MSYLRAPENVGFSGIPPNISDATCATQFKMAVEGAPAVCGEINSYINDCSRDDHAFTNDNYFHTKFKIDPNELYTFQDSDIIASEITVSHTEDNFTFTEAVDTKKLCSLQDSAMTVSLTNGNIKDAEISNGHYKPVTKTTSNKDVKTSNTKVQKVVKSHIQTEEISRTNPNNTIKQSSMLSPKCVTVNTSVSVAPISTTTSINSVSSNPVDSPVPKVAGAGSETFLDVFKREQGLVESEVTIKIEREDDGSTLPTAKAAPSQAPRKVSSGKPSSRRRGRGPTMHEALQRIARAVPLRNRAWAAPGDLLFDCGPLDGAAPPLRRDSSDEDELIPNFGERIGCVSELSAVSRGARLAMRRAALRRQLAQAAAAMRLAPDHRRQAVRAHIIKKQLSSVGASPLPPPALNELLAARGMPALLSSAERRLLRARGWSGGDSVARSGCAHEACGARALPAADRCLQHVTESPGQRLFVPCAAVFAGGGRCSQPLLPLGGQTPLCAEHAWKRDNYDKISREVRPKKMQVRKRAWAAAPREPRRDKRRRPAPATHHAGAAGADHKLSELNVCSNSSAYDSSEETGLGALGESELIVAAANELEVEQVPADDDLLDSAVLGQIPDEAFTEFFNQAEGGATFAESSELARALEAVLDERALDSLADSLPAHSVHPPPRKMQVSSVGVEMSSAVSSIIT